MTDSHKQIILQNSNSKTINKTFALSTDMTIKMAIDMTFDKAINMTN